MSYYPQGKSILFKYSFNVIADDVCLYFDLYSFSHQSLHVYDMIFNACMQQKAIQNALFHCIVRSVNTLKTIVSTLVLDICYIVQSHVCVYALFDLN